MESDVAVIQPTSPHAAARNAADWYAYGKTLTSAPDRHVAEAAFRRAIALDPGHADAHALLSSILRAQGRSLDAVRLLDRAMRVCGEHAGLYNNLALALTDLHDFAEAEQVYRRALASPAPLLMLFANYGSLLLRMRRIREAIQILQRSLLLNRRENAPPLQDWHDATAEHARDEEEFHRTQYNLSLALLSQGDYADGWRLLEARRMVCDCPAPTLPYTEWQGEDLRGRTILVCREQGYGDELMLVRYATLLKACGARTIGYVCQRSLLSLFQSVEAIDALIPGDDTHPLNHYDYWVTVMSLPHRLASRFPDIPANLPYLRAPAALVAPWPEQLSKARLRVGMAWKGAPGHPNDAHRSLPNLATLAPLWQFAEVCFVSLQHGAAAEEAVQLAELLPMYAPPLAGQDFAYTASLIERLDLVITIDSAVAHLTGALGKPCWLLLSCVTPDWRWQLERDDCPWYPGVMRLFRQTREDDWDEVVIQVTAAMTELLALLESTNS